MDAERYKLKKPAGGNAGPRLVLDGRNGAAGGLVNNNWSSPWFLHKCSF